MDTIEKLKKLSQNLSVLYVEDDDDIRNRTLHLLNNFFAKVDGAVDGEDGLNVYNNHFLDTNKFYDIVVSDLHMPNLDGIEFTSEIYKINKNQRIIIISAHDDKKYLLKLIRLGVEEFIEKPCAYDKIINSLYNVCISMQEEKHISLGEGYTYNGILKTLYLNNEIVELTYSESKLLDLFIINANKNISTENIFYDLHYDEPDKEFSANSIKSLIKRLRKKLPKDIITNTLKLGYCLHLPSR